MLSLCALPFSVFFSLLSHQNISVSVLSSDAESMFDVQVNHKSKPIKI